MTKPSGQCPCSGWPVLVECLGGPPLGAPAANKRERLVLMLELELELKADCWCCCLSRPLPALGRWRWRLGRCRAFKLSLKLLVAAWIGFGLLDRRDTF